MKRKLILLVILVAIALLMQAIIKRQTPVTTPETTNSDKTYSFVCENNKTILASFHEGEAVVQPIPTNDPLPPVPTGGVNVTFPETVSQRLAQTISADGARYANADESLVVWNKGNELIVLENGESSKTYVNCKTN